MVQVSGCVVMSSLVISVCQLTQVVGLAGQFSSCFAHWASNHQLKEGLLSQRALWGSSGHPATWLFLGRHPSGAQDRDRTDLSSNPSPVSYQLYNPDLGASPSLSLIHKADVIINLALGEFWLQIK